MLLTVPKRGYRTHRTLKLSAKSRTKEIKGRGILPPNGGGRGRRGRKASPSIPCDRPVSPVSSSRVTFPFVPPELGLGHFSLPDLNCIAVQWDGLHLMCVSNFHRKEAWPWANGRKMGVRPRLAPKSRIWLCPPSGARWPGGLIFVRCHINLLQKDRNPLPVRDERFRSSYSYTFCIIIDYNHSPELLSARSIRHSTLV